MNERHLQNVEKIHKTTTHTSKWARIKSTIREHDVVASTVMVNPENSVKAADLILRLGAEPWRAMLMNASRKNCTVRC